MGVINAVTQLQKSMSNYFLRNGLRLIKPKIHNLGEWYEVNDLISHRASTLSDEQFLTFSTLSDTTHLKKAVKEILIPRVVGSDGHEQVRKFITHSLRQLEWTVDHHIFEHRVPVLDELKFHNIIAKLNPNAERYLVLACHYDSKYMPGIKFLGATDSAVPCAMLLNLAAVLHTHLERFRDSSVSLMMVFFDGEEAFKQWNAQDSIYGARHLAQKWDTENFHDRIDLFVLLDLIGTPDPKFYSFFANTEAWHSRLCALENRLSSAGMFERYASSSVAHYDPDRYFQEKSLTGSEVEDDHIPFLRRKVPILHIIPIPFPSVWHTKDDNESVIDYATTENIARIMRLFTIEYLLGAADVDDDDAEDGNH